MGDNRQVEKEQLREFFAHITSYDSVHIVPPVCLKLSESSCFHFIPFRWSVRLRLRLRLRPLQIFQLHT